MDGDERSTGEVGEALRQRERVATPGSPSTPTTMVVNMSATSDSEYMIRA